MNGLPTINDHNKITLFTATEILKEAFAKVPEKNEYGCFTWRSISDNEIVVCFAFSKNPHENEVNAMDILRRGLENHYNMISTNIDEIYTKFNIKINHDKLKSFLKSFDSDLKAGTVTEEEILEQIQMDIKDFVDVEFKGMGK